MLKSYKNIWSLNTEEAIVAGILRAETKKHVEIFVPLNAQMKDIDLVLINNDNKKIRTVQVKGSRAYEGNKTQIEEFGYGSFGWVDIKKSVIENSNADFFVFIVYVLEQFNENRGGKVYIRHHTITIPNSELKRLVSEYKKPRKGKDLYSFSFWVNPKTESAKDFRDPKKERECGDFSAFLDKKGLAKLSKSLE